MQFNRKIYKGYIHTYTMEKVKLERMDWEKVKRESIEQMRGGIITQEISEALLELALSKLKTFPDEDLKDE